MCANRVWAGRVFPPPTGLQGIAPLTSSSVTAKTEVIDWSHQGDGGLDSSSCTAVEREGGKHWLISSTQLLVEKRSTCWNNAGRAAAFSSMSLLFSLEPKKLAVTVPQKHSVPLLSTRAHTDSKKER